MPGAESILTGLQAIARDYWYVAALWHVLLATLLVFAAVGWRTSRRRAGVTLSMLAASPGVIAAISGNPFNAIVLIAVAAALLALALGWRDEPLELGPGWSSLGGVALLAVGWVYPHFVVGPNALAYIVAAPVGTIPCPTLLVISGFTLLADGLRSRAWSLLLAVAALFYGTFGTAYLGVGIDVILIAAGLLLMLGALGERPLHSAAAK